MSSYVVLARKWRSSQFHEVVGQTHIVRTLQNAIRSDRMHQAYLFTGSRGIGKTSIARIFAKLIRCENRQQTPKGLVSCDHCPACNEVKLSNSMDVLEIDGASNNGVDAIREIRETAKFLPSTGTKKIYIIDEVHMLTTQAFNALLKTLEEPPPHVLFIFATTEPHKIPATVLSRCQCFDFKRPTAAQIEGHLATICKAENLTAEPAALHLIARAAEGSLRDSLSLLDQVISYADAFSGKPITLAATQESIGYVSAQVIDEIISALLSRTPEPALRLSQAIYEQGHDLKIVLRLLLEQLHALMLLKVGAGPELLPHLSTETLNKLQTLSPLREVEELELLFQVFHQGMDWLVRSSQPKIIFDILLVKACSAESLFLVKDLTAPSTEKEIPPKTAPLPLTKPNRDHSPVTHSPVSQPKAETPIAASPTLSQNVPAPAPSKTSAPVQKTWENWVEFVREKRPLLASILENGVGDLTNIETGDEIRIGFLPEAIYFKDQLASRTYLEPLNTYAKEFFSKPVRVIIENRELPKTLSSTENHTPISAAGIQETIVEKRLREEKLREESARLEVQRNPLIQEARSLFGAELGPIEWKEARP